MKTILVATNYSCDSNNAIKYAATLARYTNAKVILFNSFELSVHALNTLLPASSIDAMAATNSKRLKDVALSTSNTFGITVESVTRTSFFKDELDYQVSRLKVDLVVMGMCNDCEGHGHENNTTSIIRRSTYPVLLVPEGALFNGISNILFAYDPDCVHAANKLPMLKEVAGIFNAQVQVYHVQKKIKAAMAMDHQNDHANPLFDHMDCAYTDVTDDSIIDGIEKGIKDTKADMLVMVPHKYGFWEGVWSKSKTTGMACRTHIPLLSLPNPVAA